jgi:hypothetical protein
MFRFDHLQLRYEPFPIGVAKPVMEEGCYRELVASYPPLGRFTELSKVGSKYTLSERFNRSEYEDVIRSNPRWREFHGWIKSDAFIRSVFDALREHHIDLGHDLSRSRSRRRLELIADALKGHSSRRSSYLRSRFEFSMLPAKGGHVLPHTDGPSKIVTLVVSMLHEGEWDAAHGGGTDVVWPLDASRSFNRGNRQLRFDEIRVLDTFEHQSNQAVVFIKTFNSWHAVRPMTAADPELMRRTITINIETPS